MTVAGFFIIMFLPGDESSATITSNGLAPLGMGVSSPFDLENTLRLIATILLPDHGREPDLAMRHVRN